MQRVRVGVLGKGGGNGEGLALDLATVIEVTRVLLDWTMDARPC